MIVLAPDEIVDIAAHQEMTVEALIEAYGITPRAGTWWIRLRARPCPFLVDDLCSVHDVKPRQCRAYPFWPEIVESAATWGAERELCPGIDQGPVWSDSDVQQMLELAES